MPLQSFELQNKMAPTSQNRSDAQMSNPAMPVTPTVSTQATQPTEQLRTADPSNGGVVPRSIDTQNLWKGLKNWWGIDKINGGIYVSGAWEANVYWKKYGIDTGWYTKDELSNFQDTFADPNDPDLIYRKSVTKKNENYWDKSLQAKFIDAVQTIDLQKKVANSGDWVDPNVGIQMNDVLAITDELAKTSKLAQTDQGFMSAYNNFYTKYNEALKLPVEQRNAYMQWVSGALKVALIPVISKAKWKEWFDNNKTDNTRTVALWEIEKWLNEYKKFYDASSDELKDAIMKYKDQENKYNVKYEAITGQYWYQSKSYTAATKLKSSNLYKNFMEIQAEIDPSMRPILNSWKNNSVIDQKEEDFLKKNLFWHESIKSMMDMRTRMIAEQWPGAVKYFEEYQEIIDLYKTLGKSGMDDMVENAKKMPSNYDLKNLRFSIKTWY